MDMKEQSLLNYYYKKFIDNTFDEKDVYAFLLLIQSQRKEIRWINELAGFVVHRGQHKGYIKDYFFETRKKFESLGKTNTAIRIEDVFSFKEIKTGINQVLEDCQLKGLANEKINDFITCLISILQQVQVFDESEREIGKLFFALSNKQIILMAESMFPKIDLKRPMLYSLC